MLLAIVIASLNSPLSNVTQCLIGAALALVIFFYPYAKGYMGAGDAKLLLMIGMFLGPVLALWSFLFICLVGGFVAVVFALIKGRLSNSVLGLVKPGEYRMDLPYAVAIFLGTSMAVFNFQRLLLDA